MWQFKRSRLRNLNKYTANRKHRCLSIPAWSQTGIWRWLTNFQLTTISRFSWNLLFCSYSRLSEAPVLQATLYTILGYSECQQVSRNFKNYEYLLKISVAFLLTDDVIQVIVNRWQEKTKFKFSHWIALLLNCFWI